jgi:hypothetical protein
MRVFLVLISVGFCLIGCTPGNFSVGNGSDSSLSAQSTTTPSQDVVIDPNLVTVWNSGPSGEDQLTVGTLGSFYDVTCGYAGTITSNQFRTWGCPSSDEVPPKIKGISCGFVVVSISSQNSGCLPKGQSTCSYVVSTTEQDQQLQLQMDCGNGNTLHGTTGI